MIYNPIPKYSSGRMWVSQVVESDKDAGVHPDKWKWHDALNRANIEWNEYQMRHNGIRMSAGEYVKQFKFIMSASTKAEIVTDYKHTDKPYLISGLSDAYGMTMILHGVQIDIDNTLPAGRIIVVGKIAIVSFDWRGRVDYERDDDGA